MLTAVFGAWATFSTLYLFQFFHTSLSSLILKKADYRVRKLGGASVYVLVQFYPLFRCNFSLFSGMVKYDNEFKTEGNKILTKDKFEPQPGAHNTGLLPQHIH